MITRQDLEKNLRVIGWRIQKSSNGLNDVIFNHKDEPTDFVFYGDVLQIRRELFGNTSFNGDFILKLSGMNIKRIKGNGKDIDGIALTIGTDSKSFISFYNHDKTQRR